MQSICHPGMRVLCLHGGGGSAKVMRYQTAALQAALPSATFEFLEGERIWPDHLRSPVLTRMFGEGPYYGWYQVDDDGVGTRTTAEKLQDPSVKFTYTGAPEAVAHVQSAIEKRGPFDALLAFSQGAIVTTLLTAMSLRPGATPPSWRHNILVCGMPPRDERYMREFFLPPAPPLDFPCTLVHGRQDEFYEYGKRLDAIYPNATVFEHPDGHKFPGSKELTASIAAHLLAALSETPAEAPALSAERIATLRAESFADDVPVPDGAEGWSDAQLRSYFESGGAERPMV